MNFCKICSGRIKSNNKDKIIKSYLPIFNHMNFEKISDTCTYHKCSYCKLISINPNMKIHKSIRSFISPQYANSKQTNQKKTIKGKSNFLYRSKHQANYISKYIKKKNVNILDIGCFDGKLLNYLNLICRKSFFYGHDINPYLKNNFPSKKNFFFIKTIKNLKKKFDCIILSHSLMYIKNLKRTLSLCRKLLKENGKIFIQIPNIRENIFYSLMGDQYYVFTENSLINICKLSGFKINKIDRKHFSREIILILTKHKNSKPKKPTTKDMIFEKNLAFLNKLKLKLIEKFKSNKYLVLGTTVNAAFVDEIINKNVNFFVDENFQSQNNFFRKKIIQHPKKLQNFHSVILPFVKSKNLMLKKFKTTYNGNYIKI